MSLVWRLGYVALGAAVLAARVVRGVWARFAALVRSRLRALFPPPPRHDGGRVREQVLAAKRAARASGLLAPRAW